MLIPLAAAAFVFGVFPQPLTDWINPFAREFVDTVLATGKSLTF
jgi:NADH:ubiquinone oxidoreductase subunit 4 (subunit M)